MEIEGPHSAGTICGLGQIRRAKLEQQYLKGTKAQGQRLGIFCCGGGGEGRSCERYSAGPARRWEGLERTMLHTWYLLCPR